MKNTTMTTAQDLPHDQDSLQPTSLNASWQPTSGHQEICRRFDTLGFDGSPARLGIMGGTFDPIHIGHLACAEQARRAYDLDAVIFIPAGQPVFKRGRTISPSYDRLTMCCLAVEANPNFDISDMEIRRGGDTYTVDTLRQLRDHYPDNVELFFITGADAVLSIVKWKDSAAIADLARLIAVTRPGYVITEEYKKTLAKSGNFRVDYLEMTGLSISSSYLRARVARDLPIRYLVTDKVREYIENRELYLDEVMEPPEFAPQSAAEASSKSDEAEAQPGCPSQSAVSVPSESNEITEPSEPASSLMAAETPGEAGGKQPKKAKKDKSSKKGKKSKKDEQDKKSKKSKKSKKDKKGKIARTADSDERGNSATPRAGGSGLPVIETGIDPLSDEFFEARHADLDHRVKPKRKKHIEGVAETAAQLARIYGVDVQKAQLAGILHDWDKDMDDEAIRQRVYDLGLQDDVDLWVFNNAPVLLHGFTAARALKQQYPDIPDDVIQAIDRHTTAALHMTDLDMVLYIADALEPSRQFGKIDELRQLVGKVDLEELFFRTYEYWTELLFERKKQLHPDTIHIWNAQVARRAAKQGKERDRNVD